MQIDYLHKPCMSPEGILQILKSIQQSLEKQEKSFKEEAVPSNQNEDNHVSSFLRKLVDGQILNEHEYSEGIKHHKLTLGRTNFSCIAFSIIDFNKVMQRYSDSNRSLLHNSILDILNQVFLNKKEMVFFQYAKNIYIAVISMEKVTSSKEIYEQQNRNVHLISDSLKKFLNIEVGFGVSEAKQSFKNISHAFVEAVKALQHRFYSPSDKVIYYGAVPTKQDTKGLLTKIDHYILKLKECIANENFYQYKSTVEEIFALLRQYPYLSIEEVTKLFYGLLFFLDELDTCFEEMKLISGCETLEELHDNFQQAINRKLCLSLEEDEYKSCSFLVKKLLSYINQNYEKELSLSILSEHLNVSPNYISRIFKEEVGKTLSNYINEVRVEQAKKLMHQQELKIYEIGEKVGFNSSVHFNIVFNKLTGYSPRQYRDTIMT